MSVEITNEELQRAVGDSVHDYLIKALKPWRSYMAVEDIGVLTQGAVEVALEAAAPAIQEAVAYRIASKLNTLSTERAQADDMTASRHFKQAADVAVRVAKGGW